MNPSPVPATPAMLASRAAARSDAATSHERVSVVIPCRNENARIAALLDAIRSQETAVLEVVIVDTGSTDGTVAIVGRYQQHHTDLRLRCLSHPNAGIAEAMNRGIETAHGEVIVRLDGHSRPRPDYVKRAVGTLRDSGAAIVGGVWDIVSGDQTQVAEAIALAVAHPLGAGNAVYRTARTTDGGRTEVDTVPFGCFRRSTWETLGGFDEGLLTNEDYEFNYRARSSGSTVVLDRDIRCTYFARSTLADLARQYFRYGWWKLEMLKRHPRSLRWRQALPGALVPLFVCLGAASLVWPASRLLLGGFALAYAAILSVTALQVARQQSRLDLVWPLMAAFAAVHGSWSTGFTTNIVSLGRWPRWPRQRRATMKGGQRGFSGVRLLQALAGILLLAVLAPPAVATLVNRSRIDRAQEAVRGLAEVLRGTGLVDRTRGQAADDVLGGPGNAPEAPGVRQWVDGRVGNLTDYASLPIRSDPWGNRYMVNIGVMRARETAGASTEPQALWVLSAGPNGLVETPYTTPAVSAVVGGDDVGARIE